MRLLLATLSLVALSMSGCGDEDPFAPKERKVNTGAFGVVGSIDELAGEPGGKAADAPAEEKAPQKPAATKTPPKKKAQVGVGKKGHYGGQGIVKTPVSVYFRAQERITFNAVIPQNMKLYKATHNNKGPATHKEFMEEIIKKGMVDLPDLSAGERYLYDPKKEELFIEQRK